MIRLALLSPSALERLVLRREPTVLSIFDVCGLAALPWIQRPGQVFDCSLSMPELKYWSF